MAKTGSQEHHVRVREQDMFHQEHREVEQSRSSCDIFDQEQRKDSPPPFSVGEGNRQFSEAGSVSVASSS